MKKTDLKCDNHQCRYCKLREDAADPESFGDCNNPAMVVEFDPFTGKCLHFEDKIIINPAV